MSRIELIKVLKLTRDLLEKPDNDFRFSSWENSAEAVADIDECLADARDAREDSLRLKKLYVSLGPIHQVAMMSAWLDDFLVVAAQFDEAMYTL